MAQALQNCCRWVTHGQLHLQGQPLVPPMEAAEGLASGLTSRPHGGVDFGFRDTRRGPKLRANHER